MLNFKLWPTGLTLVYQAEDHELKPRVAPKFENIFQIYHELEGKGKHREETCTSCEEIQWRRLQWEPSYKHHHHCLILRRGVYPALGRICWSWMMMMMNLRLAQKHQVLFMNN